ncbi:MAG: signal peptidase II [Planctomycetes bacterium]|nr:signal peptidase II [Planctomycetota bacterium]
MTEIKPSAAKSPRSWILFSMVFAVGLLADLWSKSAVFGWVAGTAPQSYSRAIIPGVLKLTLSTNPGIVFGFNKMPPMLVLAATIVAIGIVLYFFVTGPRDARLAQAGLAMILAGAVGNLYDRLFFSTQLPGWPAGRGQVRDFIDLSQIGYPWIFNLADVLLVVGVAALLLTGIIQARRHRSR